MISRCWLHIGIEKTGTTSIQEFLALNRGALLEKGYLYPVAPGRSNHIGLACFAQEDGKYDSVRRTLGIGTQAQLERYRSRLLRQIDSEVAGSSASSLIFSNEHLSSRLRTHSEIERLKGFCTRIAETTTVVVYLRNQVDFLVSRYIEAVKGGSTDPFFFRTGSASRTDFAQMLAPWRDVFGFENLVVRRFENRDFEGGDLLSDFASTCAIDSRLLAPASCQNVALDAHCIEFLREFNRYVPHMIEGRRNPLRGQLISHLETSSTGEPFVISSEIASIIEKHFEVSNKAVSVEYFAGRHEPLFSAPRKTVDACPTSIKPIGTAECIRIAALLWRAQQAQLNAMPSRDIVSGSERLETPPIADRQGWKAAALGCCAVVRTWLKSKTLQA